VRSHHILLPFWSALAIACLATGCSKEPSAEQKQADVLFSKAKIVLGRGEDGEGRALLHSAHALDEKLGRTARCAEEEKMLGDLSLGVASFDSALLFYGWSEEHSKELADRASARERILDIASVHGIMGEMRKAYGMYEEALRFARVFNDTDGERSVEWAMLPVCRLLDRNDEEERILSHLAGEYASLHDTGRQARVALEAGVSRMHDRAFTPAIQEFLHALSLADQARDSALAVQALFKLALAFEGAGQTKESFETYSDALKRSDRLRGVGSVRHEMLTRLGNAYLRAGQNADAARFYRAALTSALNGGNKIGEGYLFIQLGHCDLPTAPASAANNYSSALELFRSLSYHPGTTYALLALASAAQRQNRASEALQFLKDAVKESRRFLHVRGEGDVYTDCEQTFLGPSERPAEDVLIETLLRLNEGDEAFRMLEQRNAGEMSAVLTALNPHLPEATASEAWERYAQRRAERIGTERILTRTVMSIGQQQERLAVLRDALQRTGALVAEGAEGLCSVNKGYEPIVGAGALSLPEAQKALPPASLLVEYVPTERSLYAFSIGTTRASVRIAAATRAQVSSASREYAHLLGVRDAFADSSAAQRQQIDRRLQALMMSLHEMFLRPIDADLAGISHVYLVLPRELPTIPLHALRRSVGTGSPYLIERCLVSYIQSAGMLVRQGAAPGAVHDVMGIGHAGTTPWDVEYELRDIRAFFKDARLYFNQQATLATLQQERADVLHIAAELQCNVRAPGNSFWILSDGQTVAGWKEILPGDLFTIPAYPTVVVSNLAKAKESVDGCLPSIFLVNGTGAVVITLTPPSRKTKKLFGEKFYTALQGGLASPQAYRRAVQEMIANRDCSAPYQWGPFFLWGK
jgi:CHAT domain-containing protein